MATKQKTEEPPEKRIREAYEDVLLAFAREPGFKEKGPGALIYAPTHLEELKSFTFGDTPNEPEFHAEAIRAYEESVAERSQFTRSLFGRTPFIAMRCANANEEPMFLLFYGWNWVDAQVFLLAFATKLYLRTPSQAKLKSSEKNVLSPAIRALLFN